MLDNQLKEFEAEAEKVLHMGYMLCEAIHPATEDKEHALSLHYKALCSLALTTQHSLKAFTAILRSMSQE